MPDAMNIPSWSDFEAARRRFFERLAADATRRRLEQAWRLPVLSQEAEADSSRRETTWPQSHRAAGAPAESGRDPRA